MSLQHNLAVGHIFFLTQLLKIQPLEKCPCAGGKAVSRALRVCGCPCHCPLFVQGSPCPWVAPQAPVLGNLCSAVGESVSWRLLISLEPALPKLNSSSVCLDCVFGVLV